MPKRLRIDLMESLITAVKKKDILYDVKKADYKNKNLTVLAWKDIADEVGRDVKFCKTIWAQLRSTYIRILIRRKSQPSGKAPKWYLFHQMTFIKEHLCNRQLFHIWTTPSQEGTPISDAQSSETLEEWQAANRRRSFVNSQQPESVDEDIKPSLCTFNSPQIGLSSEPGMSSGVVSVEEPPNNSQQVFAVTEHSAQVTPTSRGKRLAKDDPMQSASVELLNTKRHQCQTMEVSEDLDLTLIKGLLPLVKQMTPRNKRKFMLQAHTLCNDILDSQDDI